MSEMVYIGSDNDKNNLLEMKLKACELLYPDMYAKRLNKYEG
jgi:hypothetical protein